MTHTIASRIANSAIGRNLRAQETFLAADALTGSFTPGDRHDDWRLACTSAWVLDHATAYEWRRRVDQPSGRVTFEFQNQGEADAFRVASSTLSGMIRCV